MSQLDHRETSVTEKKFRLDRRDGKIAGVCGGLANYFGVNPLAVRLLFAIGAIAGFGSFILIYLAIWLLAD